MFNINAMIERNESRRAFVALDVAVWVDWAKSWPKGPKASTWVAPNAGKKVWSATGPWASYSGWSHACRTGTGKLKPRPQSTRKEVQQMDSTYALYKSRAEGAGMTVAQWTRENT